MEKTYEQFAEVSEGGTETYTNQVHVNDTHKVALATNGMIALFRRDMYDQVKCTLKLLGSEAATINNGVLEKGDIKSINTDQLLDSKNIKKEYTRKFRIKFPSFLSNVSKKKKHPTVFFSLSGDTPSISLTQGEFRFDAHLLSKLDLTQEHDVWFHKEDSKKPAYVFPKGMTIDDAESFYAIMPMVISPEEPSIVRI